MATLIEDFKKELDTKVPGHATEELRERLIRAMKIAMVACVSGIGFKILEIVGISAIISAVPTIGLFGAISGIAGFGTSILLERRKEWEDKKRFYNARDELLVSKDDISNIINNLINDQAFLKTQVES